MRVDVEDPFQERLRVGIPLGIDQVVDLKQEAVGMAGLSFERIGQRLV